MSTESPKSPAGDPSQELLSLSLEFLPEEALAVLLEEGGLARERLQKVFGIAHGILPSDRVVRLKITGSVVDSVMAVMESQGNGESYDLDRGSNVVVGRCMPAPDGSFDLIIYAGNFYSGELDSDDHKNERTEILCHTVAHECQHVLLHTSETEASHYQDNVDAEPTPRAFREAVAIAIDEYRCDLAANRHFFSHPSRWSSVADDIADLRQKINSVLPLIGTDIATACTVTLTSVMELFKALAYLAAEATLSPDRGPRNTADTDGWDDYVSPLWAEMFALMEQLPAADEPADIVRLSQILQQLCELMPGWLQAMGVRYSLGTEGQFCYWVKKHY